MQIWAEKAAKLIQKVLGSDSSKNIVYPILKGAAKDILKALSDKHLKDNNPIKMVVATLLNPPGKQKFSSRLSNIGLYSTLPNKRSFILEKSLL